MKHAQLTPRAPGAPRFVPFIKAYQADHGTRAAAARLRAGGVSINTALRLLARTPRAGV